jgi:AcrR family transcriptional regulator
MTRTLPLLRDRLRDAATDAMLQAGECVMREKGYAGATMQDIAAAAGCAVGTLYLHFKNKEELLRGILLKHSASLLPAMDAAMNLTEDPLEKLRIFVTEHVRWVQAHPAVADLLDNALPFRYYDFKAGLSRLLPREHEQMQRRELVLVRAAQAAGQIRRDIPAQALTELLDGFLFTILDQFSAHPGDYSLQEQVDMVGGFIPGGLRGASSSRAAARRSPSPSRPRKKLR